MPVNKLQNRTAGDALCRIAEARLGSLVNASDEFVQTLRDNVRSWLKDLDSIPIEKSVEPPRYIAVRKCFPREYLTQKGQLWSLHIKDAVSMWDSEALCNYALSYNVKREEYDLAKLTT